MKTLTTALLVATLSVPAVAQADLLTTATADLDAITGPEVELTNVRTLRWGGGTFVQADQTWRGLPVFGGRLVGNYAGDTRLRGIQGRALAAVPATTSAVVSADVAVAHARDVVQMLGTGQTWEPLTQLAVLARDGRGTLVQVVDVSTAEPLGAWRVFVDATTGDVITWEQRLWTARAEVYASNPNVSELVDVELPGVTDSLSNEYTRVSSCTDFDDQQWQCYAVEAQAQPDGNGDFYFTPDPASSDDPFCEVQMFWHLDLVSRWFEDQFGFRAMSQFGDPTSIEGIVNFDLQNAFYGDADGDGVLEVAFGQGGGIDYAYDADVVYHEFGHAVFGSVVDSGGGRFDEVGRLVAPSGLNEGSADLFAIAITGDPLLGEYAGSSALGDGAIRDLEADRHCPTDIYGESHRDGELWASLGWNLIEDEELGGIVTAQMVFGALNIWGEEVTFGAAGEALMEAADDLVEEGYITQAQRDRAQEHIDASGFADCGRIIRLDEGQRPLQATFGGRGQGGPRGFPTANQYSIDAPEGTSRIRLFIDEWNSSNPDLGWTAFIRRGEPVLLEREEGGGGFRPLEATEFDIQIDGNGTERFLELTDESDPPLEPGATYYVSIFSRPEESMQGFGFVEVSVTAEANIDPVEPPVDETPGDGCAGCASQVDGGGAGVLALLLGALGLGLRRRL